MLLGQILFVLAALRIAGATAVGVVYGIVRFVTFRILGKELGPQPEPGSADWTLAPPDATVDLGKPSLLTEKRGRTTKDPVVTLAGVRYRVTRPDPGPFPLTPPQQPKPPRPLQL